MTRLPLTSTTMDRAFRAFNAKLYIDTRIDPLMLAEWIRANIAWLRAAQRAEERMDEHEAYAWIRLQFLAERALNSQPVPTPTITSGPAHVSESAGSLSAYAYV